MDVDPQTRPDDQVLFDQYNEADGTPSPTAAIPQPDGTVARREPMERQNYRDAEGDGYDSSDDDADLARMMDRWEPNAMRGSGPSIEPHAVRALSQTDARSLSQSLTNNTQNVQNTHDQSLTNNTQNVQNTHDQSLTNNTQNVRNTHDQSLTQTDARQENLYQTDNSQSQTTNNTKTNNAFNHDHSVVTTTNANVTHINHYYLPSLPANWTHTGYNGLPDGQRPERSPQPFVVNVTAAQSQSLGIGEQAITQLDRSAADPPLRSIPPYPSHPNVEQGSKNMPTEIEILQEQLAESRARNVQLEETLTKLQTSIDLLTRKFTSVELNDGVNQQHGKETAIPTPTDYNHKLDTSRNGSSTVNESYGGGKNQQSQTPVKDNLRNAAISSSSRPLESNTPLFSSAAINSFNTKQLEALIDHPGPIYGPKGGVVPLSLRSGERQVRQSLKDNGNALVEIQLGYGIDKAGREIRTKVWSLPEDADLRDYWRLLPKGIKVLAAEAVQASDDKSKAVHIDGEDIVRHVKVDGQSYTFKPYSGIDLELTYKEYNSEKSKGTILYGSAGNDDDGNYHQTSYQTRPGECLEGLSQYLSRTGHVDLQDAGLGDLYKHKYEPASAGRFDSQIPPSGNARDWQSDSRSSTQDRSSTDRSTPTPQRPTNIAQVRRGFGRGR